MRVSINATFLTVVVVPLGKEKPSLSKRAKYPSKALGNWVFPKRRTESTGLFLSLEEADTSLNAEGSLGLCAVVPVVAQANQTSRH